MRVQVGQHLKMRGAEWLIDRIGHYEETRLAKEDSEAFTTELLREGNTTYQHKEIEAFEEGDIITITSDRVSLALSNRDGYYIYTHFKVINESDRRRKDADNARSITEGSTAVTEHPAAEPAEGSRDGVQDGEGVREEGAGSTSGTVHRDGPAGERGDPLHSEGREGEEYTPCYDWNSAGVGSDIS